MPMTSSSLFSRHDSKPHVNLPYRRGAQTSIWFANLVLAAMLIMPAGQAAAEEKDPFAGDVWHAVKGSWPGTIEFDAKSKKVVLSPYGSEVINATYSYTLKPTDSQAGKPRVMAMKVITGKLKMKNTLGQVSLSDFRIEGKELTLSMQGGMQVEHYKRMSRAEEEAEILRIEKLVKEGKLAVPTNLR